MGWITFEKIGDLLLGETKEVIFRTDESLKRIDKDLDEIQKDVKSIDRRVCRIEGKFGLGATVGSSPFRLTKLGEEILKNSGIKEMADQYKAQLLEEIKELNPKTAYDIQEATIRVFKDFDFASENVEKLKDYVFQNGEWGLSDILEVGAVYFRSIALDAFGFEIKNVNKKSTPSSKRQG